MASFNSPHMLYPNLLAEGTEINIMNDINHQLNHTMIICLARGEPLWVCNEGENYIFWVNYPFKIAETILQVLC